MGALVHQGQVLLVHRRPTKRAYPNTWDLPGGLREVDESELGTLERELHEELGVHIVAASTSHLCRVTAQPAGGPVTISAWLIGAWHGTPTNEAPEEHDDCRWFSLEELPPLANGVVRSTLTERMRSHRA